MWRDAIGHRSRQGVRTGASRLQRAATAQSGSGDPSRCHVCDLDIAMRYTVLRPKSSTQGYREHLDGSAGIAANGDHDAVR
jgi:hypothetical protein